MNEKKLRFRLELTNLEERALASATLPERPAIPAVVSAHVAPLPSTVVTAQATPSLKSVLESARSANDVPALAGGLIVDGKLSGVAVTGVREQGKVVKVQADDQFHLGSNGKAMTSTLAAILVEKGFIRWNTTISQAFPELRGQINPAYANVTLEQLLNHRSGFTDENVDPAVFEKVLDYRGSAGQARQVFLKDILKTPAGGAVGSFNYSNTGYTLAATMMERATGNYYEWLMQKYIFNPLAMTSAGFGPPGRGYGLLDQPRGHDPQTGKSVGNGRTSDAPAILNPAGLIHMNMADWSKFLRVHLGQTVNGKHLLSNASLTKLHTADPRPTNDSFTYGFGWVHIPTPQGDALWHNGSNEFWYSEAVIIPSKNTAVFAVSNQAGDKGTSAVTQAIAALEARAAKRN